MINQKSIDAVAHASFGKSFIKPLYDSYCFSRIPGTIQHALTGHSKNRIPSDILPEDKLYNKVVFLFIDGFGWKFFDKNKEKYPVFQRFVNQGVVSKGTSQYPSTTPVHAATINSGLEVGEHGMYEWLYYEPKVDNVIAPLLFSLAKDKERNTLQSLHVNPSDIYPTKTFYEDLQRDQISSYVFSDKSFAFSPFNVQMNKGVKEIIAYETLSHALVQLYKKILNEKDKSYYFFYYGKIDTMGHHYGPDSLEFNAELDTFFTALEKIVFSQLEGKISDALFLLSADHGQSVISPEETIYLNKTIPNISSYFLKNKTNIPIVPAGSSRNMYLHVKEESVHELIGILKQTLKGKAEVYETNYLIKEGFFGENCPSKTFLSRVGNVVILPYEGNAVWWYEKGIFEQSFKGHHGGLSRSEVEIPLLTLAY